MIEQHRTIEFFNKNVADLAEALQNRVLIDQASNIQVQLTRLEPYPKVGSRYRDIVDKKMQPGELWTPYIPLRRMSQSLIVARGEELESGACVRILRASYYNLAEGGYVAMPREGDIAEYFGMGRFERVSLRFLDDSDSLYLIKGNTNINAEQANTELGKLLGN